MSLNVPFACGTLVASEQGRTDHYNSIFLLCGARHGPDSAKSSRLSGLLFLCPSMPRETLTGTRAGGRESPICRRRRSASRCPGSIYEKGGDIMFGFPVWMLKVIPCLWGFCKVPIPCTFEGSTNPYKMQRLKRWYPTGFK